MKLQLALKAEYFDAIKAGLKTEEYRLVKPYWMNRLHHSPFIFAQPGTGDPIPRTFSGLVLTKGYPRQGDPDRILELPWRGFIRKTITHPHFGPDPVEVFAINVEVPPPRLAIANPALRTRPSVLAAMEQAGALWSAMTTSEKEAMFDRQVKNITPGLDGTDIHRGGR